MTKTMNEHNYQDSSMMKLSERDFLRLSEFIHRECGIKMPPAKKIMLESRLQKRIRHLGMLSLNEYCQYLFTTHGIENELVHMIDVVTTNKTDFFREPGHFDYMVQKALPTLITNNGSGIRKKLMVWSAGCSTGEEPYTLAMVLSNFAERCPGVNFEYLILATDISTKVLQKAKQGVYSHDDIEPVPLDNRKKYLLKSRNKSKSLVRVSSELREHVKFRRLNFLEGDFGMREPMDIIFCRNVIIYFDRPTQSTLLNRFYRHVRPGGYMFLGHSETLHGLDVPFVQVAPTVYRKPL